LTKQSIRSNFDRLQSRDNSGRNCQVNTSGGSTGEPLKLIQDDDFRDASAALRWLTQYQLGCEVGQTHHHRPRLIIAYAQAIYELAQFVEQEQIRVVPQRAVLTSAGTLYEFMREKIGRVFGCEVYNLYGSREVSDVAWELPGSSGLWAPPWANFIEIVDEKGAPAPEGTGGNILITCLTNYAMPLVRYSIGDRGALLPRSETAGGVQILSHVAGRNVDVFRRNDRTLVDGEYFTHLLYFRTWVRKFQVVQKSTEHVVFKVVSTNGKPPKEDLDEITNRCRLAMGADCRVDFEFVEELPALPSGKFRYTISEVCC
jgi:phenylacetate-CoA ligase